MTDRIAEIRAFMQEMAGGEYGRGYIVDKLPDYARTLLTALDAAQARVREAERDALDEAVRGVAAGLRCETDQLAYGEAKSVARGTLDARYDDGFRAGAVAMREKAALRFVDAPSVAAAVLGMPLPEPESEVG